MSNNQLSKVSGTVEAVGTKFNGSVLVNGQWYNLKKGVANTFVKGMNVTLDLEPWEWKGKSGLSVVSYNETPMHGEVVVMPLTSITKPESASVKPFVSKQRDFDAEARGKTRCQMFSAALQSPVLQQYFYTKEMTLEDILKVVQDVADKGTEYTFGS